jgi:hypothetical protein
MTQVPVTPLHCVRLPTISAQDMILVIVVVLDAVAPTENLHLKAPARIHLLRWHMCRHISLPCPCALAVHPADAVQLPTLRR